MADRLSREMGYTRREFVHNLASALQGYTYCIDGPVIHITLAGQHDVGITITLGEEQLRRIASIAIPYIPVNFDFTGINADEARTFLKQFDLHYQKGGG